MFSDFLDDFNFLFGNTDVKYNTYGRTKDMKPIFWESYTDDNGKKLGYKWTVRSIGVSPENVHVECEDNCIYVYGKNEPDDGYSFEYRTNVNSDLMDSIENIKYESKNGITTIYIFTKPVKKHYPTISRV